MEISIQEFLSGSRYRSQEGRMPRHDYTASLEGRSVVVQDAAGNEVEVRFGGTSDNRTVYAYIDGVGFIGGWQYPYRAQPFQRLVESINRGILYRRMEDLPKRFKQDVDLDRMSNEELRTLQRRIEETLQDRE